MTWGQQPPGYPPPPPGGYGPPPQPQWGYQQPVMMQAQGFRCAVCGCTATPILKQRISTAGWIVFAVLIFLCIFLCWIPLITMREQSHACPQCRALVGGGFG